MFVDQLAHEGGGALGRLLLEQRLPGGVEQIASKLCREPDEVRRQALVLRPRIDEGRDALTDRRHLRIPLLERLRRVRKPHRLQLALVVVKALHIQDLGHRPGRTFVGEGVQQTRQQVGARVIGDLVLEAEQLLAARELRHPDLIEGDHIVGGRLREPGREDALVQLAVVRGLDRHEDLVVVQAAELIGEGLEHRRVVTNLVEEQGPNDGGARWRRRGGAARSGCAGIQQRRQCDAAANPDADAQPAVEKGPPAVAA